MIHPPLARLSVCFHNHPRRSRYLLERSRPREDLGPIRETVRNDASNVTGLILQCGDPDPWDLQLYAMPAVYAIEIC
jgi:hypothetical protein